MQQIKVFKTNNIDMLATQDKINQWIETENVTIHQITTTTGAYYLSKNLSYATEVEIFIMITYSKNN